RTHHARTARLPASSHGEVPAPNVGRLHRSGKAEEDSFKVCSKSLPALILVFWSVWDWKDHDGPCSGDAITGRSLAHPLQALLGPRRGRHNPPLLVRADDTRRV